MSLQVEIRELIADVAEIEEDLIGGDTHLVNDLQVDSLAALEVLAVLEKKHRIHIPETSLVKMTSLNNIVEIVQAKIDEAPCC